MSGSMTGRRSKQRKSALGTTVGIELPPAADPLGPFAAAPMPADREAHLGGELVVKVCVCILTLPNFKALGSCRGTRSPRK
jgi:hypothetical protein